MNAGFILCACAFTELHKLPSYLMLLPPDFRVWCNTWCLLMICNLLGFRAFKRVTFPSGAAAHPPSDIFFLRGPMLSACVSRLHHRAVVACTPHSRPAPYVRSPPAASAHCQPALTRRSIWQALLNFTHTLPHFFASLWLSNLAQRNPRVPRPHHTRSLVHQRQLQQGHRRPSTAQRSPTLQVGILQ